jgi:soluble cytochrome b562
MTGRGKTILAALALAGAFAAGWEVQGWRLGLKLEQQAHQQTSAKLSGSRQAVADMAGFQKGFNDALSNFQQAQQGNIQAQQELGRLLLDLRSTTAGLRGDFAGLPERISAAAKPALAEYASTCTAVFEAMAAGGGRLAEAGGELARQADGHATDAGLTREAWPR